MRNMNGIMNIYIKFTWDMYEYYMRDINGIISIKYIQETPIQKLIFSSTARYPPSGNNRKEAFCI